MKDSGERENEDEYENDHDRATRRPPPWARPFGPMAAFGCICARAGLEELTAGTQRSLPGGRESIH